MVVTVEAILEPSDWDADYELNSRSIIKWIHDNWDEVGSHIEEFFDMKRTRRFYVPPTRSKIPGKENEIHPPRTGVTFWPKGEFEQSIGTGSKTITTVGDGGVAQGQILGTIVNKLQQKDSQFVHKFEELLFANMGPGFALKYVGSQPLVPKRIEIFESSNWIEV